MARRNHRHRSVDTRPKVGSEASDREAESQPRRFRWRSILSQIGGSVVAVSIIMGAFFAFTGPLGPELMKLRGEPKPSPVHPSPTTSAQPSILLRNLPPDGTDARVGNAAIGAREFPDSLSYSFVASPLVHHTQETGFHLRQGYGGLQASIGLTPTSQPATVKFEVFVDGNINVYSRFINSGQTALAFTCDIHEVDRLRLVVTHYGGQAIAVWGQPTLIRANMALGNKCV